jgi:mono/diheme cytochrome c family protein
MMNKLLPRLLLLVAMLGLSVSSKAAMSIETFEIEGLISPASPLALISELQQQLDVKVVDLNLKNTPSGWPVLSVEFDSAKISRDQVEKAIASIEDPAGHNFKVHIGPPSVNAPFTQEETEAMARFGPAAPDIETMANPIETSADSVLRGKNLFENYCTTCHGLSGNGQGPAAHGITTFPRQLWVWNGTDSSTDGYLFWFITNGRNEMPPWGLILSENNRWDVINYIKTLENPG